MGVASEGNGVLAVIKPCALNKSGLLLGFKTLSILLGFERVLVLGPVWAADLDVVPVAVFNGAFVNAHWGATSLFG